jgi:uncharacterized membrane protein YphA (DoxX/SURF4 family)
MQRHQWRSLAYWVATAIAVLGVAGTGLLDLTGAPVMAQHVTSLGYPAYLQHFLGLAKMLGAAVIVLPALPRLKEWAYAGMTFDLVGAAYSHVANRDPAGELVLPLALLAFLIISYALRPDSRRMSPFGSVRLGSKVTSR